MESPVVVLLVRHLKLISDINYAKADLESYIDECNELISRVRRLSESLNTVIKLVKEDNPRLCKSASLSILSSSSKTLEATLALLKRCGKGGIWMRILTITAASEFKKVGQAVSDAIINVNWLVESATEDAVLIPIPPICSGFPNKAVIWNQISKLQGDNQALRQEATGMLANLTENTDQNCRVIIDEGGIPQLLRVLHDGELEAKQFAAEALGNIAKVDADLSLIQQLSKQKVVPAFCKALESSPMQVQSAVAWALSEMVYKDPNIKEEFGNEGVIRHLVALMLETMDDKPLNHGPMKAQSLPSISRAAQLKLHSGEARQNSLDGLLAARGTGNGNVDDGKHHKSVSESRSTFGYVQRRERENVPPHVKKDLKVNVTRALCFLAAKSVANSRRITETRAMLGFAKIIETEEDDVQKNVLMAVMRLTAVAEEDTDFRKFAFKMTSPPAKAVITQLLRIIQDPKVESEYKILGIRAIGSLAKSFSTKDINVIECLVSKISDGDDTRIYAIEALQKFVDDTNYLHKDHSLAIVKAMALLHLVQIAAHDEEKSAQFPAKTAVKSDQSQQKSLQIAAIHLLTKLVMCVGRTQAKAFTEAAALNVLKSLKTSASKLKKRAQFPIDEYIQQAINLLEFHNAGDTNFNHSAPNRLGFINFEDF